MLCVSPFEKRFKIALSRQIAVHGQPEAGAAGLGHPVADMAGQEDLIAASEMEAPAVGVFEFSLAFENHYPFVLILVVPCSGRGAMAVGEDAFDPCASRLAEQDLNLFFRRKG